MILFIIFFIDCDITGILYRYLVSPWSSCCVAVQKVVAMVWINRIKFVFTPLLGSYLLSLQLSQKKWIRCDENKKRESDSERERGEKEREKDRESPMDEWEKEKQKCSLCRMFLTSPCRQQVFERDIHYSHCFFFLSLHSLSVVELVYCVGEMCRQCKRKGRRFCCQM